MSDSQPDATSSSAGELRATQNCLREAPGKDTSVQGEQGITVQLKAALVETRA